MCLCAAPRCMNDSDHSIYCIELGIVELSKITRAFQNHSRFIYNFLCFFPPQII